MTLQFNCSSSLVIFLSASVLNWEWKLQNLASWCLQSVNQSIMSKALKSEEECCIHFLYDSNQLAQYSSCLRLWTLIVYSSCHSIVSQITALSITCCLLSHLLHYFSSRREIFFCTHIDWEGLLFVFLWISHMWFILLFLYPREVELFLKLLTME